MATAGGGAVTVTLAAPLLVGSVVLVATTWQVRAELGAVYTPAEETEPQPEPSWTVQVTDATVLPVTAAANMNEPPAWTVAVAGFTATATCGAFLLTFTTLVPLLFTDAMALSARTWKVPSVAGAV